MRMSFVLALCGAKVDDYIRVARTISIDMSLYLSRCKSMAIYVAEIKEGASLPSMPIQAPLLNSSYATPPFATILCSWLAMGYPLGRYDKHPGPPSTRRRGGKMACVACQGDPTRRYRERRPRVDCVPCCTYRSRPKKTAMNEPKALRCDPRRQPFQLRQRWYAAGASEICADKIIGALAAT